ncbi:MAG: hypothetical protein LH606_19815 [Cytophagaceae bacterium]|nr:hypothetical protein [Cytophagaceae bacterium]
MNESLPLEKEMAPLFLEKLPAFPPELKEGIAKYGPYVVLVLALIAVVSLLALLGLTAGISVFATGSVVGIISLLISLVVVVLEIMAFSPLQKRQRRGWNLLYYAGLISAVGGIITSVLAMPYGFGALIGTAIGFFIQFWILFQIREKYS